MGLLFGILNKMQYIYNTNSILKLKQNGHSLFYFITEHQSSDNGYNFS